jgi:hypothetical protein
MADVSRVGVSGPLGLFMAGFVAELSRPGFQPGRDRLPQAAAARHGDGPPHTPD